MLVKLRDENTPLLEVWLASGLSTRVKLRRSRTVTVAAPDLGFLAGDVTLLCHINLGVSG